MDTKYRSSKQFRPGPSLFKYLMYSWDPNNKQLNNRAIRLTRYSDPGCISYLNIFSSKNFQKLSIVKVWLLKFSSDQDKNLLLLLTFSSDQKTRLVKIWFNDCADLIQFAKIDVWLWWEFEMLFKSLNI